jgi:SAM-dependent methyltransferase
MDYRKPVVFGENWSPSRYKVLPYFAAERRLLADGRPLRLLDLGCAAGWNMSRFVQYGQRPVGLDVAAERVVWARLHGPVAVASGLQLPFARGSFDLVYIQHVLHHIGDVGLALAEVYRCLRPGGVLFLVETVEDNPLIRWGRSLHPVWLGDAVNARFRFARLKGLLGEAGFAVEEAGQYSVLFWLWEVLPDHIAFMERLTPLFVAAEQAAGRLARTLGAHCFLVARRGGGEAPPRS